MYEFVRSIGSAIIAVIMYSVPIITTIAFERGWSGGVKMGLVFAALLQVATLVWLVWSEAERKEDKK